MEREEEEEDEREATEEEERKISTRRMAVTAIAKLVPGRERGYLLRVFVFIPPHFHPPCNPEEFSLFLAEDRE